jgi:hypothetical protein
MLVDKYIHLLASRLKFSIWLALLLIAAACTSPPPRPAPAIPAVDPAIAETATPSPAFTPTISPTSTPTPRPSPTQTPTQTLTPSITPTYAILRGEVLVRSNCRYGPGAPYLYKYGLVAGSNLEVIGRNDLGTWILVRAIGGNNPCWVKASLMNLRGDVMTVAPTEIPLPPSPYYGPLKGVSANRVGDEVSIFWSPLVLRAGDDSGQFPYVVEAWVCQDGQLVFTPFGTYATALKVTDQAGCSEPSHGQVRGAEKHGYTIPVEIPWPQHP